MGEISDRSLRMLATAIEKEKQGKQFYDKAVSDCTNKLAQDIFRTLAAEEAIHIKRAMEIHDSLQSGTSWSQDWKSHRQENENLRQLFRDRIAKVGAEVASDASDVKAVEIGLEFEQGAIDFYEKELTGATDSVEKEFIERMIQEERTHYASLSDLKLYLSDPASWFAEMERHGLDGA